MGSCLIFGDSEIEDNYALKFQLQMELQEILIDLSLRELADYFIVGGNGAFSEFAFGVVERNRPLGYLYEHLPSLSMSELLSEAEYVVLYKTKENGAAAKLERAAKRKKKIICYLGNRT